MIYELAPTQFGVIAPLAEGVWTDRALIDSVAEGTRDARVFVDDAEQPRAAFLCVREGDYYLLGDPSPSPLRQFIKDTPGEAEVFNQIFAYFLPQAGWQEALAEDSEGAIEFFKVRAFRFLKRTIAPLEVWQKEARADVTVQQINEHLLRGVDEGRIHTNHEFSREHLEMIAGERFGFCVVVEGEVASVAWAYATSSRFSSLFIDTAEPFRRQGLATLACAAFIDYSLAHGMEPLWACLDSNLASAATALKLGFEEVAGRIESAWEPHGRNFKGPMGLWVKQEGGGSSPPGTTVWERKK
ncbi:MAG TPA: GNAT family N-acetyltransferase [Ardenticatenaceae bacterium]|jgi:RimJ/RimL family protein N-acetyltransferase